MARDALEMCCRLLHEATRALQRAEGVPVIPAWNDLPADDPYRESSRRSIAGMLINGTDPEVEHERWRKERISQGWVYGPVRDNEKKIHPDLVPYAELGVFARSKDIVRIAIFDVWLSEASPSEVKRVLMGVRGR